jgi:hypothetical protein
MSASPAMRPRKYRCHGRALRLPRHEGKESTGA